MPETVTLICHCGKSFLYEVKVGRRPVSCSQECRDKRALDHNLNRSEADKARRAAIKALQPPCKPKGLMHRNWRAELKDRVITLYGGKCACCGEANRKFLTLDHVNQDGYVHRQTNNRSGGKEWKRAERAHGDGTFQVLCFNCNCGRALNGGVCPHQENHA